MALHEETHVGAKEGTRGGRQWSLAGSHLWLPRDRGRAII